MRSLPGDVALQVPVAHRESLGSKPKGRTRLWLQILSVFKLGHFESVAAGVTSARGLLFPGWYFSSVFLMLQMRAYSNDSPTFDLFNKYCLQQNVHLHSEIDYFNCLYLMRNTQHFAGQQTL